VLEWTAGSSLLCLCGLQGAVCCVCVDCREQLANCVADTSTVYAIMIAYIS
jgi:hypothetical protein